MATTEFAPCYPLEEYKFKAPSWWFHYSDKAAISILKHRTKKALNKRRHLLFKHIPEIIAAALEYVTSTKQPIVCVPPENPTSSRTQWVWGHGVKKTKENIQGFETGPVTTLGGMHPLPCSGVNRFHVCLHFIYCSTCCCRSTHKAFQDAEAVVHRFKMDNPAAGMLPTWGHLGVSK